jgi:ABC-type nitrate/sulfonate/bicarbonate transport system permease component
MMGMRSAPAEPPAIFGTAGKALLRLWPFALFVLGWHAWIVFNAIEATVAPTPLSVLRYLAIQPASYLADAWQTLSLAGTGLTCGVAVGVVLATVAWASPLLGGLVSPAALLMRTVPLMALIPVIARVLGYSSKTIIAVASLISFFPAFVFVRSGLEAAPSGAADLFTVLGAHRWARLRYLAGPAAVPYLLVALRISAITCIIGALVAEWLLGTRGLGYRLALSQMNLETQDAWAAASVAVGMSLGLFGITSWLERLGKGRFT